MQTANLKKAGLLAIVIFLLSLLCWELYLRQRFYKSVSGISLSYDDNDALWADKRAMVYEPADQATVFIGSSRMRFDIDIPTWEGLTGDHAIQLALDGGDPRPILADLAKDQNFKGKLLIDVTEGIFFYKEVWPSKKSEYYHKITPTQRFSFQVNHALESTFVFLDQDNFSLNIMLNHLPVPKRAGVIPEVVWPVDGARINFDRQEYFTPHFLADTNESNLTKSIWQFFAKQYPDTPVTGKKLDSLIYAVKADVDLIKKRGGRVIFTRTPSNGFYRDQEMRDYPKAAYWDRLLELTGCQGVYYADYPAISRFICPEWSHLKPDDAVIFTKNLVRILEEEKGWTFKRKPALL